MKINVKQVWETEVPMTATMAQVLRMKKKAQLETGDKHTIVLRNGKAYMRRMAH